MTYNPQEFLGPVGNYPLYAKKVFLTFLQAYFSQYNRIDNRFYWTNDFRTTKLLIVDKKSYDTSVHERRPTIIISRHPAGFANATLGQISSFNLMTGETEYSDLLPMSVSINCVGQNGAELEELASIIVNAITAFKSELYKEGVREIRRITIGEETQLRNDVNDIFAVVPVGLSFVLQSNIAQTYKFYPLTIKYTASHIPETVDSTPNPYWENSTDTWFEHNKPLTMDVTLTEGTDYTITLSGLLSFTDAPATDYYIVAGEQSDTGPSDGSLPALGSSDGLLSPGYLPDGGATWEVWYTRADTLESTTYTLPADGTTTIFSLPGGIYGYGTIFQEFDLTTNVSDEDELNPDLPLQTIWGYHMVASYEELHGTLAENVRLNLLSRFVDEDYLYDTFGLSGQNKTICDFLILFHFDDDLISADYQPWKKTGTTLRWDCDGSVSYGLIIPNHILGDGDGIMTITSTDGWGGVTGINVSGSPTVGSRPYTGQWPNLQNIGFSSVDSLL